MASPQCGSWTRNSENCDYGDIVTLSKDCYMCFNCGNSRDLYYCEDSRDLKNCTDCAFCEGCELCYECTDCNNCYNSDFCQDCSNCRDIHFSYDLRRCNNCFGCSTLRDKQFRIFNEQYSKQEYEEKIKQKFVWQKLEELKLKTPRMYVHEHDTTECTGDYIYHSKNCHMCFDTRHSEDSGYIYQANLDTGTKDCFDCGPIATSMELCYDCAYPDYCFECKHLYWCSRLKNCEWCCNCIEGNYLFGCHYLKNKSEDVFCIFYKIQSPHRKDQNPFCIFRIFCLINFHWLQSDHR